MTYLLNYLCFCSGYIFPHIIAIYTCLVHCSPRHPLFSSSNLLFHTLSSATSLQLLFQNIPIVFIRFSIFLFINHVSKPHNKEHYYVLKCFVYFYWTSSFFYFFYYIHFKSIVLFIELLVISRSSALFPMTMIYPLS